jgi:ribonuclease HII
MRTFLRGVRESKQLSEKQREEWYTRILAAQKAGLIDVAVMMVSEKVIDKRGLSYAIRTALAKSLRQVVGRVISQKKNIQVSDFLILLDGGLRAPVDFIHQKTIIRGDVKEKSIAIASIYAKVTRDRFMHKLAKKYPQYGFGIHKGYGTRAHYTAIAKFGQLPAHRKSFLGK